MTPYTPPTPYYPQWSHSNEHAAFTEAQLRSEVERVRRETVEECLNCYSPDDTATDWADKIKGLLK